MAIYSGIILLQNSTHYAGNYPGILAASLPTSSKPRISTHKISNPLYGTCLSFCNTKFYWGLCPGLPNNLTKISLVSGTLESDDY